MNGVEKRLKHISILFSEGSDEGEHAFHETIASKRPGKETGFAPNNGRTNIAFN